MPLCTIFIDHVVNGALVVLFKYGYVYDLFTHKNLILYLGNDATPIGTENNDLVNIRAIAHKLTASSFFRPEPIKPSSG
jgi:hypothetical protein